jgi:hypothetical protein
MSHNVFSRRPNLWTIASVPNARDLQLWDVTQYRGVDGDNGGTWTPTTPIGLGGAGVQLSNGSLLDGGFTTELGGRYSLGDSDFPTFQATRTRTVRFPLNAIAGTTGILYKENLSVGGRLVHRAGWFDPASPTVWFPIDSRFIHNGATISAMRVYGFQTQFVAALSSPPSVLQATLYNTFTNFSYDVHVQWQPTHAYSSGAARIPLGAEAQTGLYYKVTTPGTSSGAGQPAPWPSVIGNTVVDGTVHWTAWGNAGTIPQAFPYLASAYYNNSQPWTILTNPVDAALATTTGDTTQSWAIGIVQDGGSWCWSAAEIDYTAIPNMAFA